MENSEESGERPPPTLRKKRVLSRRSPCFTSRPTLIERSIHALTAAAVLLNSAPFINSARANDIMAVAQKAARTELETTLSKIKDPAKKKAIESAYKKLKEKDEKKQFLKWVRENTKNGKFNIDIKRPGPPASEQILEAFRRDMEARESKERIGSIELDGKMRAFLQRPEPQTYLALLKEWERFTKEWKKYAGRKLEGEEKKRLAELEAQLEGIKRRLKSNGVMGVEGFEGIDTFIRRIGKDMETVGRMYFALDESFPSFLRNNEASALLITYAKHLDRNAYKIMQGGDLGKQYLSYVQEHKAEVRAANERWEQYYDVLSRRALSSDRDVARLSEREFAAMAEMQGLEGFAAIEFLELDAFMRQAGLSSEEAMFLIARGAYKANYISPSLAIQYFRTVRRLAEICEDDPQLFVETLTAVNTWIDAKTSSIYNIPLVQGIPPDAAYSAANSLSKFFRAVASLKKEDYTRQSAAAMVDENLRRNPQTGNYEQRKLLDRFTLLNPQGRRGAIYRGGLSPFSNVYAGIIPGSISLGGVYAPGPTLGQAGTVTPPRLSLLSVHSGADEVVNNTEEMLWPEQTIQGINAYIGIPRIRRVVSEELLRAIDNAANISIEMPSVREGARLGAVGLAVQGGEERETAGFGYGALTMPRVESLEAAYGQEGTRKVGAISSRGIYIGSVEGEGHVVTTEGGVVGFEKIPDEVTRIVGDIITRVWKDREQRGAMLVRYSQETTYPGSESYRNGAFYLIIPDEKDPNKAHVFRLEGIQNDAFFNLNTIALRYGTKGIFVGGAYQPHGEWHGRKTGSSVVAFDVGEVSFLLHGAKLPLTYINNPEQRNNWVQVTAGLSINTIREREREAYVQPVYFYEFLSTKGDQRTEFERHILEVRYLNLNEEGWSLDIRGAGGLSIGRSEAPVVGMHIRGERPGQREAVRIGGGIVYEGASISEQQLAQYLQYADENATRITSLRNIAFQLYGDNPFDAEQYFFTGLAELLLQTRDERVNGESTQQRTEAFFKLIGVLRGLENNGVRISVEKAPVLSQLLSEVNEVLRTSAPQAARERLNNILRKYVNNQAIWDYGLEIRISESFGVEAFITTREIAERGQELESGYARLLFKFWEERDAFISMEGNFSNTTYTLYGANIREGMNGHAQIRYGMDLLNYEILNRAVVGGGVLLAPTERGTVERSGYFGNLLVSLYDSKRKLEELEERYLKTKRQIEEGKFGEVAWLFRKYLNVPDLIPKQYKALIEKIVDNKLKSLTRRQATELRKIALRLADIWYDEQREEIRAAVRVVASYNFYRLTELQQTLHEAGLITYGTIVGLDLKAYLQMLFSNVGLERTTAGLSISPIQGPLNPLEVEGFVRRERGEIGTYGVAFDWNLGEATLGIGTYLTNSLGYGPLGTEAERWLEGPREWGVFLRLGLQF